ncbi:MAG: type II secretion system F family protein [Candidatus Omnitrophota bacterium]
MNESVAGSPKPEKFKEPGRLFDCHVRLRDLPDQAKTLTLEAPTKEAAIQKLLAQNYMVIDVREHDKKKGAFQDIFSTASASSAKGPVRSFFSFSGRVTTREAIFFAVQLSTLLKAGIPLLRSLEIIEKGIANPFFRQVLGELRKKISGGGTFSNALRSYPKVFPWIWVNLVEVGEATGKLPDCLEEIAHYQESAARIQQKVITAFFYPGVLTVAVIAALTFLLLFIIPKFSAIFEAQNMTLPLLTRIVIGASDILRLHFFWVAGLVVAAVIAYFYTRKIPSIKMSYDKAALGAPLFGAILMQVAVIRFTRSLGTLLRAGVQILQALEIAGRLVDNLFIEAGIKRVAQQVQSGQGLGVQLEARKIFPVFMTQLIAVGEESGQLDRFLGLLSDYYEDQVDTFLTRLTTLLEPILLVFMGGVIGTIVVSMFLPIFQLTTGTS